MRATASIIASSYFTLLLATQVRESLQWTHKSLSESIRGARRIQHLADDQKARILDAIRRSSGDGLTVIGFLRSMNESLVANPNIASKIVSAYQTLYDYLQANEVDTEIDGVLNARLADNWSILGIMQKKPLRNTDRRDAFLSSVTVSELTDKFTMEEAERYIRCAVAAYGDNVIDAANVDMGGEIDLRLGDWTKTRVSEHIGIPEEDLVLVDTKYSGDATQLRHFIAVDHEHRKVVVAIRGTFTYSEVTVDLVGYSRPFCGGEAHAGIALMTERLWEHTRENVLKALHDNDGYELILTGHSLGGAVTLLLNILLQQDEQLRERQIRAFAYAAPPVYSPLSAVPQESLKSAVQYIHRTDEVPFLSGNSIRHQIAALGAIDKDTKDMELMDKARLLLGIDEPSNQVVQDVERALYLPLPEKPGMPLMTLPVMAIGWIWDQDEAGKQQYNMKVCDPLLLAKSAIPVDSETIVDHYPTRYERAFSNIAID